jgi:Protein of unknown function (DUF551)
MTQEWIDVNERLPVSGELVLVTGDSGYTTHERFYISAYYDAEYRPLSPWQDVTNTSLEASGFTVTHWCSLDSIQYIDAA